MRIIKIFGIKLIHTFLHLFFVFPIHKKTIFFCSFGGMQYSDSPKFISEAIHSKEVIKIWAFNKDVFDSIRVPEDVIKVKKGTLKFYYYYFTSKIIIINNFMGTFLGKRKEQVLINTWHGGGSFKTVGLTDPNTTEYDKFFFKTHGKNTTAYISSSEFFSEAVIKKSFHYEGEILKTGCPRNSMLFEKHEEIKERVYSYFGLDGNDTSLLVLYAPTYRNNATDLTVFNNVGLDFIRCKRALERKFGRTVIFLYRAHHLMNVQCDGKLCLDATGYPDMQDLVYCSDILFSDYSSCMWDFALMEKPIFQFVPDIDNYKGDRDFLLPIEKWNFIIAKNNDEMEDKINTFNREKYINGINDYLTFMNVYDNKDSTKLVCGYLESFMKG